MIINYVVGGDELINLSSNPALPYPAAILGKAPFTESASRNPERLLGAGKFNAGVCTSFPSKIK